MKLLVLGGTVFVGRHLVATALARGHEVSLFNRGQRNPDLFPEAEHLRGDRDPNVGDGLRALAGRRWDAAVDVSGYLPRHVGAAAQLLAEAVDHYTFVSTISVYSAPPQPGMDESAPLQTLDDPAAEEVTGERYGGLKVLCEQAVSAALPERHLIIRPGMIVGPDDPTDRFPYWAARIAQGGAVLVPGAPDRPVQLIDTRDLGAWLLTLVERKATGTFNATGPAQPLTWADWMTTIKAETGSDATFTYVPDAFLGEHAVNGGDLPFWVPAEFADIFAVSIQRALATGLTHRPLAETVRDTIAWDQARPADTERRAGWSREREAEVLAAWHQQSGA
ncbi:MAG: epimerase [Chloroflexi bacterium]|nr:epimerase [Chloroflexota bacterium]